jgi:anti-sigma-K factor RskA
MNIDHHDTFQRMIDESLAGVLSAEKEQSLREHLSTCATCREYLSASNRVIAGLSGFSFEVNPTLNARVLAALRLQAEEGRGILARDTGTMRQHSVPFTNWAAFAVALSMSFVGSGLVYQMAERLAVPMHFVSSQVQAGVLVFWLLPSLCAALCLLAAPSENRGIA